MSSLELHCICNLLSLSLETFMLIDYSRQAALTDLAIPRTVTVVGTGAVGCWLAYFAALGGAERLIIYTFGSVKPTDIARFPFPPQSIGKPYAFALPNVLFSVRPDISLEINGEFRPEIDQLEGVVFNCAASEFDDFDTRLFERCRSMGLRYISGCYSGHTVYVTDSVTDKLPRPSLDSVPAWAGSAALAGLHVLYASSTHSDAPLCRSVNLATGRAESQFHALAVGSDVAR